MNAGILSLRAPRPPASLCRSLSSFSGTDALDHGRPHPGVWPHPEPAIAPTQNPDTSVYPTATPLPVPSFESNERAMLPPAGSLLGMTDGRMDGQTIILKRELTPKLTTAAWVQLTSGLTVDPVYTRNDHCLVSRSAPTQDLYSELTTAPRGQLIHP